MEKDRKIFVNYVLPTIATILTLSVLSQFYMTSLTQTDLLTFTGDVISIKQDKYRHHKYTEERITIFLSNSHEPFFFFETKLKFIPHIMKEIEVGDRVTLYRRTKIQSRLGTGSQHKIMQIKKGTELIYDFADAKKDFTNIGSFGTYVSIGMWLSFIILNYKMRKRKATHNSGLPQVGVRK